MMISGKCKAKRRKPCKLSKSSLFTDCTKHETFFCPRCERVVSWDFGCDDDMPALCDDCWSLIEGAA